MDSIWRKIWKDTKYQFEEVMDRATYLEHLQVVLKKLDLVTTSNENVLI